MSNPFDQFDSSGQDSAGAVAANPFDQFDPPPPPPAPPPKTSQTLGYEQGVGHFISKMAGYADTAGRAIGLPMDSVENTLYGEPLADAQNLIENPQDLPGNKAEFGNAVPGKIGRFAADVQETIPATMVTKNPWLQGGASAGLLTDKTDPIGALEDIGLGTLTGGAAHYGLKALSRAASPVIKKVASWLPGASAAPAVPPAAAQGADYVQRLLDSSGKSLSDLSDYGTQLADKPVTAAEGMGPPGISALAALGRRQGATGAAASAQLGERAAGRGDRMLADYASAASVVPEAAQGDIDSLVQAGRQAAKPLYDQALSTPGPIWNDTLQTLAKRPVVQKAMSAAAQDLANADIHPGTFGLAEDGSVAQATTPKLAPAFQRWFSGSKVSDASGAPLTVYHATNQNFDKFDLQKSTQGIIWFTTDKAGAEAGTVGAQGSKIVMPLHVSLKNPAGWQEYDKYGLGELKSMGHDGAILPNSDGTYDGFVFKPSQVRKAVPLSTAQGPQGPTAQAWDLVKKNLGSMIERNPFGKPIPDSISRGNYNINKASQAVTDALKDAIPGYGDALAVSGDYLTAQKAFENGQKFILSPTFTAKQMADYTAKLSPAEMNAFKGGIANQLFNKAQNNQLHPSVFTRPILQSKLATVLGPENSAKFLANMKAEADMARAGARMAPGTNSVTSDVMNATGEQDSDAIGAVMDGLHAGLHLSHGNVLGATGKVTAALQKLGAFAKTPGMSVPVRDEAGRLLLMKPADLVSHLQSLYGRGDPAGVQAVTQFLARLKAPAQIALPAMAVQANSNGP